MNNDAFEKAFSELKCAVYCKDDFLKIWQAATKAALGSRVVLPDRRECTLPAQDTILYARNVGFNECLDQIKLIPLTAEQVDSLLPRDEIEGLAADFICFNQELIKVPRDPLFKKLVEYSIQLRESIKKRLGGV